MDEPPASLGTRLQLPAWLEPHRTRIEAALPPLAPPRPREVAPLDFIHRYEPPARPGAPTLLLRRAGRLPGRRCPTLWI